MDEYAEGRLAYTMDREITANPYDPTSAAERHAHAQWRAGWIAEYQLTHNDPSRTETKR